MMDTIEIYKDKETIVEISKDFHELARVHFTKIETIDPKVQEILIMAILGELVEDMGWDLKDCKLNTCSEVPVFNHNKILQINEKFSIFESAFGLLAAAYDSESLEMTCKSINDYYANEVEEVDNFYCKIFDKNKDDISLGAFAAKQDDQLTVLLFFFKENDFY